jgi:hypothetical protein
MERDAAERHDAGGLEAGNWEVGVVGIKASPERCGGVVELAKLEEKATTPDLEGVECPGVAGLLRRSDGPGRGQRLVARGATEPAGTPTTPS